MTLSAHLNDIRAAIDHVHEVTEVTKVSLLGLLAVSSGFGDQVSVIPAWRVDEGMSVSLAA
jgi:hypothetical protein